LNIPLLDQDGHLLAYGLALHVRVVVGVCLGGDPLCLHRIERLHLEAEGENLVRDHVLDVEYDLSSGDLVAIDLCDLPDEVVERLADR